MLKLIMAKIIDWVKKNWLTIALLLLVLYLYGRNYGVTSLVGTSYNSEGYMSPVSSPMMAKTFDSGALSYREAAPSIADQRLVIQDTTIDQLVNDVAKASLEIEAVASKMGGYLVNKGFSKPEGAGFGHINIRVPAEKRDEAVEAIKAIGVKTVGYEVYARDVTDAYTDLDSQLASLIKVKSKMELILDQATRVSDLMDIQTQINNIQMQIDNVKGQQNYLSQTAKYTKIKVNLSTDELALPYVPDSTWRPMAVFKSASRSMVGTLRFMVNSLIWLVVYVPVLLIIGLIVLVVKIIRRRTSSKK